MDHQEYADITSRYGRSMTALAKEMSKDIGGTLKVTQGWPPSWDPQENVIRLPFFVNADLLPDEALHDGRSFIGHESGEAEYNTLKPDDPRWKDKAILKSFVNILGDVRINLKREEDYPGFKRSHRITNASFVEKFKKKAAIPVFDPTSDTKDTAQAALTAMCLVEMVQEGAVKYGDVMSWELNPKIRKHMQALKPECDLELKDVECEDIASHAQRIYKTLKIADLVTEEEEQQVVYGDGDGDDAGNESNWGAGKDYGEQLCNSMNGDADLNSGEHSQYDNINTYTFDPSADIWTTFGNNRESQIGEIAGVDIDRLAMVLGNRLIKLLQVPAAIPSRHQTEGRIDPSRISQVLHYRQDVFKRKVIEEKIDAAVTLSVDCSSSMCNISEEVRAALSAWSKALQMCGVPHEILGWSQRYNHRNTSSMPTQITQHLYRSDPPIYWQAVKKFSDDWKVGIYNIKYQMHFSGGTPSGEGISTPGWRLAHRQEPRKILIVFTDGSPALHANGPSKVHDDYIESSVAAFRRRGMVVMGVALNSGCFPYVKQMFGEHHTVCLDGAGDLMTRQGGNMLKSVLGRSGRRR